MESKNITFKVYRYDPSKDSSPKYEEYTIPYKTNMKVLHALLYLNEHLNVNVAFEYSCREWLCGSCTIMINGEPAPMCKSDAFDGMILGPLPGLPIVRDLVVNRDSITRKIIRIRPYLNRLKAPPKELELIKASDIEDAMKVSGCVECLTCISICPVVQNAKDRFLGPMFMNHIARLVFDPRDDADRVKEAFFEGLYSCTTCRKCVELCPREINNVDDVIEKLRKLAVNEGVGPLPAHTEIAKLLMTTGKTVTKTTQPFLESLKEEEIKIEKSKNENGEESLRENKRKKEDSNEKIGLFVGCIADYRLQNVAESVLKVCKENGIELIIPKSQVCCGSVLMRTGQTKLINDLVKKNVEAFSKFNVKKILTACAGCSLTLKNDYPKLIKEIYGTEMPFKIYDLSEFLINEIGLDKTKLKEINMKVTYHDPCHLRRGQNIFKEPREILKSIPGIKLVEMEKADSCCGAGGGVRSGNREISEIVRKSKAEFVKKTDAEVLVTECPFCLLQLTDMVKEEGLNIKVMYLMELLAKAYGG